ncbi:MAG: hypothetical protein K8H87_07980 [Pseudorhodoplanes sp.]|nr:hypothetical protein [Pseudorhodoplanes sp.]
MAFTHFQIAVLATHKVAMPALASVPDAKGENNCAFVPNDCFLMGAVRPNFSVKFFLLF